MHPDDFADKLSLLLGLDDEKAAALAELLDDRMRELADKQLEEHVKTYSHEFDRRNW